MTFKHTPSINVTQTPWFTLDPWELLDEPRLHAIASYLNQPATQQLLAELENERTYPRVVRQQLHALGLSDFFIVPAVEAATIDAQPTALLATFPHLVALISLCTAANGSLGITVGVNMLALLPIYIAGNAEQLAWMAERLRRGDYAALFLTELAHGSDLLANETLAETGTLDGNGEFVSCPAVESATPTAAHSHYRLYGRKDTINGGSQHELMVVFARSRAKRADSGQGNRLLAGRNDFELLLVDRNEHPTQITSPQRWHTLPTPAADIASAAFDNLLIPTTRRLGKRGQGFQLVQQLLPLSRAGVSAFAVGVAACAHQLARDHATTRQLYGQPIGQLGVIGDHLRHMQALEWLLCALSIKSIALINSLGGGAVYYASLAKYGCCALAETLVDEGRLVYGSRALLLDFPYHRQIGDVLLFGSFDGTSHLVLDQLQWRLAQMAQAASQPAEEHSAWQTMQQVYQARPRALASAVRHAGTALLLNMPAYLAELANHAVWLPINVLQSITETLLALVRHCRRSGDWERAQGLRFDLAKQLTWLEALIALAELADPGIRAGLGIQRPLVNGVVTQRDLAFCFAWFGGKLCAELRRLAYTVNAATILDALTPAETTLGTLYQTIRNS
jgi:alkylation response protein AidB-like acyl-CoA dehydrogenase